MFRRTLIGLGVLLAVSPSAFAAEAKHHIVQIVSDYDNLRMSFKPKRLVVEPGDTVT